ncbi:hypothetical protein J5226_22290 [Lysobacter sp. K5869]|uniref:hypothetical protein n=1 Tax=Lysobacter sp. K5869 TaxID=2820808 RepID=UPI001C06447F|nr:hypothetical protein [Lysobacter sp. K5869]QWP76285.1 hypothetical protein J5226_22290 [Lysobacter sp. K5869]
MNSAPPGSSDPAETAQAVAPSGRPARNDVRGAGKWLMLLALGVLMAGLVAYKLIVGDGLDGYGMVFFPLALVVSCIAAPLGLIGAAMWLIGLARSRGGGERR